MRGGRWKKPQARHKSLERRLWRKAHANKHRNNNNILCETLLVTRRASEVGRHFRLQPGQASKAQAA